MEKIVIITHETTDIFRFLEYKQKLYKFYELKLDRLLKPKYKDYFFRISHSYFIFIIFYYYLSVGDPKTFLNRKYNF